MALVAGAHIFRKFQSLKLSFIKHYNGIFFTEGSCPLATSNSSNIQILETNFGYYKISTQFFRQLYLLLDIWHILIRKLFLC